VHCWHTCAAIRKAAAPVLLPHQRPPTCLCVVCCFAYACAYGNVPSRPLAKHFRSHSRTRRFNSARTSVWMKRARRAWLHCISSELVTPDHRLRFAASPSDLPRHNCHLCLCEGHGLLAPGHLQILHKQFVVPPHLVRCFLLNGLRHSPRAVLLLPCGSARSRCTAAPPAPCVTSLHTVVLHAPQLLIVVLHCSSSFFCCRSRACFGLAASHLHMPEPCASLTRAHFTGSALVTSRSSRVRSAPRCCPHADPRQAATPPPPNARSALAPAAPAARSRRQLGPPSPAPAHVPAQHRAPLLRPPSTAAVSPEHLLQRLPRASPPPASPRASASPAHACACCACRSLGPPASGPSAPAPTRPRAGRNRPLARLGLPALRAARLRTCRAPPSPLAPPPGAGPNALCQRLLQRSGRAAWRRKGVTGVGIRERKVPLPVEGGSQIEEEQREKKEWNSPRTYAQFQKTTRAFL
jgi:hypothetical protein